jgi:hypothetical protein
MKTRMHCADCRATGLADTLLEGSDWIEMAGWLFGGLPGWLYCAWRHQLRIKVCSLCGSGALMRESRAQARRNPPQAPPSFGAPVANHSGPSRWPRGLREPRQRLRLGGVWLAAWALAAAGLPVVGGLLAAALLGREAARGLRHFGPGHCRAWDAQGRPLHIELA